MHTRGSRKAHKEKQKKSMLVSDWEWLSKAGRQPTLVAHLEFFHDFRMFLIVFDHANACTSMRLLVEIHNNHLTFRQMFLTWIPDKSAIQIPTAMVIEWFCYSNVCHLDPHCVPNLFKSVYHFICGDSWLSTGGRWNVELKRRLNVVINSRNSRDVQGDFHGGIIYRKKRFCLRVQTGCK